MERVTELENGCKVKSFGLGEEEHKIAVDLLKNNKREEKGYHVDDSSIFVDEWIEAAEIKGNNEYADFLKEANDLGLSVYTLYDDWQPIGEVVLYE